MHWMYHLLLFILPTASLQAANAEETSNQYVVENRVGIKTTESTEQRSAPRNVQARPLSSTTILIQWDQPEESGGQVTGYKIFYTTSPVQPLSSWETLTVDNNEMTTIANLKALQIYTIKVQAFTQRGPGPLSVPVQVKTQQGVPGQPQELKAVKVTATQVQMNWRKPSHSRDAITGYEIYWNDTFTQQEYRRSIPSVESFTLGDLYPNTLYWVWVSGKSIRGEGAATLPIPVKTEPYGESTRLEDNFILPSQSRILTHC